MHFLTIFEELDGLEQGQTLNEASIYYPGGFS